MIYKPRVMWHVYGSASKYWCCPDITTNSWTKKNTGALETFLDHLWFALRIKPLLVAKLNS